MIENPLVPEAVAIREQYLACVHARLAEASEPLAALESVSEMREHLNNLATAYEETGLSATESMLQATRKFGNAQAIGGELEPHLRSGLPFAPLMRTLLLCGAAWAAIGLSLGILVMLYLKAFGSGNTGISFSLLTTSIIESITRSFANGVVLGLVAVGAERKRHWAGWACLGFFPILEPQVLLLFSSFARQPLFFAVLGLQAAGFYLFGIVASAIWRSQLRRAARRTSA